jgi:hypothetical protein
MIYVPKGGRARRYRAAADVARAEYLAALRNETAAAAAAGALAAQRLAADGRAARAFDGADAAALARHAAAGAAAWAADDERRATGRPATAGRGQAACGGGALMDRPGESRWVRRASRMRKGVCWGGGRWAVL